MGMEIGILHHFLKKFCFTRPFWDAMKQIVNGRAGVGKTEYLLNCKENNWVLDLRVAREPM